MNRVFMTGLTGKSGGELLRLLGEASLPCRVRTVARREEQKAEIRKALPDAEVLVGDLTDPAFLAESTKETDVVFHIAGIQTSWPLVQAAAANGVRRFVLVHTTGIYSKYKAAGETYRQIEAKIDQLSKQNHLTVTYLRPTMIYGRSDDRNMIQFIKMVDRLNPMPMVNHGKYLLQPVNYRDLGRAYLQVLEHLEQTGGKSYILSGRDPIYLDEMFREIGQALGVQRQFFSVPFPLAYAGAWGVFLLTLGRKDLREKVQRLCEDRSFPHEDATRDFGYAPMAFPEGLRLEVEEYLELKRRCSS